MIEPQIPPDEAERLASLAACWILDTAPEPTFDETTALVARTFGVPIALVSLVDSERQWFKSRVGITAKSTPRSVAFCAHAILAPRMTMVVEDAELDPRFSDNPLVLAGPRIRFYAGTPLLDASGHALGTLCIADTKPRVLLPDELEHLRILARHVARAIELRRTCIELALAMEQNAELRSQLDAMKERQRVLSAIETDDPERALAYDAILSCLEWLRGAFPDTRCAYAMVGTDGLDVLLSLQPEGMTPTSGTRGHLAGAAVLLGQLGVHRTVGVGDIARDPRAEEIASADACAGARAVLAATLVAQGGRSAWMLVESKDARDWTADEHELLRTVADEFEMQLARPAATTPPGDAAASSHGADDHRLRAGQRSAPSHRPRKPLDGVVGTAQLPDDACFDGERRTALADLRPSAETPDRMDV